MRDVANTEIAWTRPSTIGRKRKLFIRQIGATRSFAYDDEEYHCLKTIINVIVVNQNESNSKYLLGILNQQTSSSLWTVKFYDQRKDVSRRLRHLAEESSDCILI